MPRFLLRLPHVIRRARNIPLSAGGTCLSLPWTSFSGAAEEPDVSVLDLFLTVARREPVARWLSKAGGADVDPVRERRALMRLDAATRLARMCIDADRSPALVVLLDALTEATREFRAFERQEVGETSGGTSEAYPQSCALALRHMRQHAVSVIRQLYALSGHPHPLEPSQADSTAWPLEIYAASGSDTEESLAEEAFRSRQFLLLQRRLDVVLPYSANANTTPRVRPSDETVAEVLRRLTDNWRDVVGTRLAACMKPVSFTGRKRRRLLVAFDPSVDPPWGSWSHLSPGPH